MYETSTMTIKGQVTIPAKLRQEFNLKPGKKVAFIKETGGVKVKPVVDFFNLRGSIRSKKPFNLKKMRQISALSLGKRVNVKTPRR